MGGQNHQPTNRNLTAISAWLSRQVSDGFALVLSANSRLEDAIIQGMDKIHCNGLCDEISDTPRAYLQSAIYDLEGSISVLFKIEIGFDRLFEAANKEGYKGNPLVSKLSSQSLMPNFEGNLVQPAVNQMIWSELESRISETNILPTLLWEKMEFSKLQKPTEDLVEILGAALRLNETSGAKEFVEAVENNLIPLRQYYARVFSRWNYLHCMFLYSSLIMTELFYGANGFPSLLEFESVNQRKMTA